MTSRQNRWRSEWEIPPGQFVLDALDELGVDERELAGDLGMNQAQFKALINGDTAVTDEIAHTLASVTGRPAETWLRLQLEYDRAIARNRMQHETGADTFVYRIDDEFGRPVEYGIATNLADIVTQDERIGDELSLDQITDRLHPDVAARKLAKLQRAFRNRKERQAAETVAKAQAA